MDVRNQKITILGLGESGVQSAVFLKKRGAHVFVSEYKTSPRTESARLVCQNHGIAAELGKHSKEKIENSDLVIICPGIAPHSDIYRFVESKKIPMMSEIELAARFFDGEMIGVTGTNGKTTVTTLIAHVLNACSIHARSAGNIGNPLIGEIESVKKNEKVVVELSSFQLQNTFSLKPKVAVLLNIEPDHLDWHASYEEYCDAKFRLFMNQTKTDYAVLNAQDPVSQARLDAIPSKQLFFNQNASQFNPNIQAVQLVAQIYDLDAQQVTGALRNCPRLEHRLEVVPSNDPFEYINDSKSTNISSLKWALKQMSKKVWLICGGKNKGGDFTELLPYLKDKVKKTFLIGETQDEMDSLFRSTLETERFETLRDAVLKARGEAKAGDMILFSPACASFDMFFNYIDRGNQFKKIVQEVSQADLKRQPASKV